jgi:hypothetical protein
MMTTTTATTTATTAWLSHYMTKTKTGIEG